MKHSKCSGCSGTGLEDSLFKEKTDPPEKCYSCKGTGINHRYTDDLVCPYCGWIDLDSWERSEAADSTQCGECEKHFRYETETTRTFTSEKVDCLNGGEHNMNKPWDYGDYLFTRCNYCDYSKKLPKEQPHD